MKEMMIIKRRKTKEKKTMTRCNEKSSEKLKPKMAKR